MYKPFRPFGRGITLLRGLTNLGYYPFTKWDDPPSMTDPWDELVYLPIHERLMASHRFSCGSYGNF